jgi:hypothetical protein
LLPPFFKSSERRLCTRGVAADPVIFLPPRRTGVPPPIRLLGYLLGIAIATLARGWVFFGTPLPSNRVVLIVAAGPAAPLPSSNFKVKALQKG